MEEVYRLWDALDLIPIGENEKALHGLAVGMMTRAALMSLWLGA